MYHHPYEGPTTQIAKSNYSCASPNYEECKNSEALSLLSFSYRTPYLIKKHSGTNKTHILKTKIGDTEKNAHNAQVECKTEIITLDMDSLSLSHQTVSATFFYLGSYTVAFMLQTLHFFSLIKPLTFNSLFINYESQ